MADSRPGVSLSDFRDAVRETLPRFSIDSLTKNQFDALYNFSNGKDVFVSLPTGTGKSLIFQLAPLIEAWLASNVSSELWMEDAIVIVISPLLSLMKDQVNYLNSIGLKATYIGSDQDESICREVEKGKFTHVYISPEASLSNERWRKMLESEIYRKKLIGIAVDEVHCVTEWGTGNNQEKTAFRAWYGKLNELRSLVRCPFLALTATATQATKQLIMEMLEMRTALEITQNPDRPNIIYVVQKMENNALKVPFLHVIREIRDKGSDSRRTVIYCQTIKQCALIFNTFKAELRSNMYAGENVARNRLVEMLHSATPESVKSHVQEQFATDSGHLRVLIATIAYGMGVNCKNVTRVIHFGPPKKLDAYLQESGRCGRGGEQSIAVLLYNGITIRVCNQEMKQYIHGTTCRRQKLLQYFGYNDITKPTPAHVCCDICAETCECKGHYCDMELTLPTEDHEENPEVVERVVTADQMSKLGQELHRLRKSLAKKVVVGNNLADFAAVSCPNKLLEFGREQCTQVLANCYFIFSQSDVAKYVDVWQKKHARKVFQIISHIFDGTESMECDTDSDSDSDDSVEADDEWVEIAMDPSFLSLLNDSQWEIDTEISEESTASSTE